MRALRWWFWSVKPPNENWAQTLVRVLGNWLRLTITAFVLFLVVVAVLQAQQDAKQKKKDEILSRVDVNVRFAPLAAGCSAERPYLVTITNNNPDYMIIRTALDFSDEANGRPYIMVSPTNSFEKSISPLMTNRKCYRLMSQLELLLSSSVTAELVPFLTKIEKPTDELLKKSDSYLIVE